MLISQAFSLEIDSLQSVLHFWIMHEIRNRCYSHEFPEIQICFFNFIIFTQIPRIS